MSKKDNDYYVEIATDEDKKIDLSTKVHEPLLTEKEKNKIKWWIIIFLVILLYLFYDSVLGFILGILKANPTIYQVYLNLEWEIVNNTLKGLFLASFLGSIFFLVLPSEALFIYFLESTTFPFFIIITIMFLGNLTGLIFNYWVGRLLGERVIGWMFKKNFKNYKRKVDKYGGIVLFFGNIFPGPIEVLTVFYGGFKFNFRTYVFLCAMGRLLKYVLLFVLYMLFWEQITFYYDGVLGYLNNVKTEYIG